MKTLPAENDTTGLECCDEKCLESLHDQELSTIQSCREEFQRMKRSHQTDFIFCHLRSSYVREEKKMKFVVAGRRVCETAWKRVYTVKDRRYRQIKRKVKDQPITYMDATEGRQSQKFLSTLLIEAKNFITDLARRCGHFQPDFEEIHLPCAYSKNSVYVDYVSAMQSKQQTYMAKSYFLLIWRQHLPHIKIRKFQRFSKCQECTNFREALSAKLCKDQRLLLFEQRRVHLKIQEIAREKYYKHRSKSRTSPSTYLSLIIDNMDSGKTNLPRFPESFKSEFTLAHIQHHVTGVLSHGRNSSYIFTWTDEFSSDCNITLNCLMSVLEDTAKDNGGCLPPVLYLQADNSAKDNKNKFVLAFLAMLVKEDILKKVKLTFLMVGHTHEDVDQMFSCVNKHAKHQKIVTLSDLHRVCEEGYSPHPTVIHLDSLWDFRQSATFDGMFQGIKEPHVFKLEKKDGLVSLTYKDWPLSTEQYREVNIDHVVPNLHNPSTVIPNKEKITSVTNAMRRDLNRWADVGKFSQQEVAWWESYLTKLEENRGTSPTAPTTFPKYATPPLDCSMDSNLRDAIDRHIQRLDRRSEIRLVHRRRN